MTWAEKVFRRIAEAQAEGQVEQKFRMEDVLRVVSEYRRTQSSLLSDHARGNPQGLPVWFIRHKPGLYSLDPNRLREPSP